MDSLHTKSVTFTAELAGESLSGHWWSRIPGLKAFMVWFKTRRPLLTPDQEREMHEAELPETLPVHHAAFAGAASFVVPRSPGQGNCTPGKGRHAG